VADDDIPLTPPPRAPAVVRAVGGAVLAASVTLGGCSSRGAPADVDAGTFVGPMPPPEDAGAIGPMPDGAVGGEDAGPLDAGSAEDAGLEEDAGPPPPDAGPDAGSVIAPMPPPDDAGVIPPMPPPPMPPPPPPMPAPEP